MSVRPQPELIVSPLTPRMGEAVQINFEYLFQDLRGLETKLGTAITPVAGAVAYSTASALALSAAGASGQLLQSAGTSAPGWTTATYPATAASAGTLVRANGTNWVATTLTLADTVTAYALVYASSANALQGLTTALSAMLTTDGSGVPGWVTTLPGAMLPSNVLTE